MKHKLTHLLISAGLLLSLSSCEIMLNDLIGTGYYNQPAVQTGTNAAQTSFSNGVQWQSAKYDDYGVPIYGYADGAPYTATPSKAHSFTKRICFTPAAMFPLGAALPITRKA